VRPVTDELLIGIAGVTATVSGLFFVGVFFFIEVGSRRRTGSGRALLPYMRAGTRIVLFLFAMALLLSLALVALDLVWSRALYVVMCVIVVAANIETAVRVRTVQVTGSRTLLLNEVVGSVGVVAIAVLPWLSGDPWPGREGLTLASLLALAAAFVSVGAIALAAFDVVRVDAPEEAHDSIAILVRRFYEQLWNGWDDAAVDRTLAPGFTFRGSLGQETTGRDGWRAYRDHIRQASADFHNDIVTLVVDGDTAAARLRYSGTHTGDLLGYAPTGRAFSYSGAAFFTAADGLLTGAWVLGDLQNLRDQLAPDAAR
jgi:predicted ester cyclase